MNTTRSLIAIATILVSTLNINAQTSVYKIDNNAHYANTVTYFLPKSELQVFIVAKQEIEKVGPFFQYAERYLGIKDIVKQDNEQWNITKIKLQNRCVVDSCKHFAIDVNKKTTAFHIQVNSNGTLCAVNTTTDIKGDSKGGNKNSQPQAKTISFDWTKLSEDALNATSMPKMAELAAKQIYAIRESRASLIAGDNDNMPDGNALKIMLKQLDETEAELTALFVGKKVSNTIVKALDIKIDEPNQENVICRFSSQQGVVDSDNLIGEPIYLKIEATQQPSQLSTNKKEKMGIIYNVPTIGKVTIYDLQKTWIERDVTLPQFGALNFVPAILFDESNTIIELDRFGGLKQISK